MSTAKMTLTFCFLGSNVRGLKCTAYGNLNPTTTSFPLDKVAELGLVQQHTDLT